MLLLRVSGKKIMDYIEKPDMIHRYAVSFITEKDNGVFISLRWK